MIEQCCIESNSTTFNLPHIDSFKNSGSLRFTQYNKHPEEVCNMLRQMMTSEGVCKVTLTDSTPCTAWLDHWWSDEPANKGIK